MEYVLSVTGDPASAIGALQNVMQDGDTFTAVAIGTAKLDGMLNKCISAGSSKTYRLMDESFKGSDSWAMARIYAAFIEKYCNDAESIIFTRYSTTLPMLAHLIAAQQFCYVSDMGRDDDGLYVVQDYGDEKRRCRVPRGSVISFKEDFESKYEDKGASSSEIKVIGREPLELAERSVGFAGSRVFAREVC